VEYLRRVDFAAFDATKERLSQKLLDRESGATTVGINCVKTPPGGGSPPGRHTHPADQIFYVLQGTMSVEIEGKSYEAPAGTLIIFPKGVPHKNWNGGTEPTIYLIINTALPEPGIPFSNPV
jgi:quercetin dioxygenase-like cupin family protein